MTEDMFTEQANVLSRLGTSEEAAKVRAKMQSSSLLSDMQAFKVSLYNNTYIYREHLSTAITLVSLNQCQIFMCFLKYIFFALCVGGQSRLFIGGFCAMVFSTRLDRGRGHAHSTWHAPSTCHTSSIWHTLSTCHTPSTCHTSST